MKKRVITVLLSGMIAMACTIGMNPVESQAQEKVHTENQIAVQDAEDDSHHAESDNRHPDLHQQKAYRISGNHHYPVCGTSDLRSRVIRLQQVINRQIVNGKENAHTEDGNDEHGIIQRILCSAGSIQQYRKASADDGSRQEIDFYDLPQTDLKQLQYKFRLLVERIRQQTVIAVHEERLRKSRSPVDGIHDKHEIRKEYEEKLVHRFSEFRRQITSDKRGADECECDESDFFGSLPQKSLMAPYE